MNSGLAAFSPSPVWKTSDYACWSSASVDYWRPGEVAGQATGSPPVESPGPSGDECVDGVCGLPDPEVEYDE